MTKMAIFEGKESSNDIINNSMMSDDEIVAYVPPRYLSLCLFGFLDAFPLFINKLCLSVVSSVFWSHKGCKGYSETLKVLSEVFQECKCNMTGTIHSRVHDGLERI